MRLKFVLVTLLAILTFNHGALANPQKLDPDVEAKVERVLAEMTLDEKIGQLNFPTQEFPQEAQLQMVRDGQVGAMLNVVDPKHVRKYSEAALQSRLKIPLLIGIDSIYAFRITFPPPIAWAATWDPVLAERACYWLARDTTTVGINWTFAPMVDISRDPRWGRVIEGAGEDPYLGAAFAAARVHGYRRGGLATSVKHFVGYGAPEGGRDYNGTQLSISELHDRYLPPFKAALAAGAETVMASFNTVNGVPVTMHGSLIRGLLKETLGFDGIVTSDFVAIGELVNHGVAPDRQVAARLALMAGIDLDMESDAYVRYLKTDVEAGRVPMAMIDDSVRRVLRVKFRLGLFDKTQADLDQLPLPLDLVPSREAAREMARDSFVLLKNHGHYLPITPATQKIVLVGAAADTGDGDHNWSWPAGSPHPQTETLRQAIEKRLTREQTLVYEPAFADRCGQTFKDKAAAVTAAQDADIVVYVVTEDCLQSGEGISRTNLDLSGKQQEMFEALVATSRPIVLVVQTGRPLTLKYAEQNAQSILIAWLPGTEGRTALAEVLLGEHAPSGRLPMSFPRAVGQIPLAYDGLPTSRPAAGHRYSTGYVDEKATPLYPFGHGLTYTSFHYNWVKTSAASMTPDGSIDVDVNLTNIGDREGREVVQIYTRQLVASRSRPMRQLKGFKKVSLQPRETMTVRFTLKAEDLGYHDDDGKLIVEPAPFTLFAGADAAADLTAPFDIVAVEGNAPASRPTIRH